jgi:hypothetical protein
MNTYPVIDGMPRENLVTGSGYGAENNDGGFWEGMEVSGDKEDGSGMGFGEDYTIGEGDGSDSYGNGSGGGYLNYGY